MQTRAGQRRGAIDVKGVVCKEITSRRQLARSEGRSRPRVDALVMSRRQGCLRERWARVLLLVDGGGGRSDLAFSSSSLLKGLLLRLTPRGHAARDVDQVQQLEGRRRSWTTRGQSRLPPARAPAGPFPSSRLFCLNCMASESDASNPALSTSWFCTRVATVEETRLEVRRADRFSPRSNRLH